MLKGIAASAGVNVAKAYKLEAPVVVIEKKAGEPVEEIKKFDDALAKTVKDIEGVKERAAKRLSEEELAVFDAHLMDGKRSGIRRTDQVDDRKRESERGIRGGHGGKPDGRDVRSDG